MKIFTGKVIGKKMQKTATVAVGRIVAHPVYKKRIKLIKKYQVHDEVDTKVGQTVRFVASKPYSKLKKWKIVEVVGAEKGNKGAKKKAAKTMNKKKEITKDAEKKSEGTEKKRKITKSRKKKGT